MRKGTNNLGSLLIVEPHHFVVLHERLIVIAQRGDKQHGMHVVEDVNPFSSLRFLSADVENSENWR